MMLIDGLLFFLQCYSSVLGGVVSDKPKEDPIPSGAGEKSKSDKNELHAKKGQKNKPTKDNKQSERVKDEKDKKDNGKDKKESTEDEDTADTKKSKIFDKENYVEAPLPKTNPWKAPGAAPPTAAAPGLSESLYFISLSLLLRKRNSLPWIITDLKVLQKCFPLI